MNVPMRRWGCQKQNRVIGKEGCRTKISSHAARERVSFSAARELRRYFQNESILRLAWMQRKARTLSAPGSPQNMPDCLHLFPMRDRQPASMTPEPMKYFLARKVPYCIFLELGEGAAEHGHAGFGLVCVAQAGQDRCGYCRRLRALSKPKILSNAAFS